MCYGNASAITVKRIAVKNDLIFTLRACFRTCASSSSSPCAFVMYCSTSSHNIVNGLHPSKNVLSFSLPVLFHLSNFANCVKPVLLKFYLAIERSPKRMPQIEQTVEVARGDSHSLKSATLKWQGR